MLVTSANVKSTSLKIMFSPLYLVWLALVWLAFADYSRLANQIVLVIRLFVGAVVVSYSAIMLIALICKNAVGFLLGTWEISV